MIEKYDMISKTQRKSVDNSPSPQQIKDDEMKAIMISDCQMWDEMRATKYGKMSREIIEIFPKHSEASRVCEEREREREMKFKMEIKWRKSNLSISGWWIQVL